MERKELEKLGLSKEQIDNVLDMHHKEYDPISKELEAAKADLTSEKGKTSTQENTIKELKESLENFKDADVDGMKKKIADLEQDIQNKEAEHRQQIADRDFSELLKEGITKAKGLNQTAITSLLKLDELKASRNQKEDIETALKALAEAKDSKMLFGEPEGNPVETRNIIGQVKKPSFDTEDAAMRAVMGLPPVPATEQK